MTSQAQEPLISAETRLPELTLKAFIIAIILTLMLSAANVYLALKIGTTISASIPASILAIGILRFFQRSNILECNLIQTAASAGEGVACAVSYILPAMIILHIWKDFSFFESTVVTLLGGLLGVLFSIPLRPIFLNMPVLKFPEGIAIGNVLIGATKKGTYLKNLVRGGIVGGLISLSQTGFKVLADNIQFWRYTKSSIFGVGFGLSPAMLAAGFIIGIQVGIPFLVGVIIGWVIILPLLAHYVGFNSHLPAYSSAMNLWSSHLRFVGVGNILVAGIWTLITLIKPVYEGLYDSFKAIFKSIDEENNKNFHIPRTEKDLSIFWVLILTIFFGVLIYIFLGNALRETGLTTHIGYFLIVTTCTVLYILIVGFMLAVICRYFSGLVGSTNSPLSGILILALLLIALIYQALFSNISNPHLLYAIVIFVSTIMVTMGSITNENLQDLKAGQMLGATPWKQQFMLAIGVVVSSVIIAPVLNLLLSAYGIGGVFPRAGMNEAQMLSAPQAVLMGAIVNGVFTHKLNWNMIFLGCVVAVIIIIIDELLLKRKNLRLPPLAVGMGVYLPPEITTPIVAGCLLNFIIKQRLKKQQADPQIAFQRGILLACGMVAGSSLMGVILAIPFVILGNSDALMLVGSHFTFYAGILGFIVFLALCLWFYRVCLTEKKDDK